MNMMNMMKRAIETECVNVTITTTMKVQHLKSKGVKMKKLITNTKMLTHKKYEKYNFDLKKMPVT